ncbi:MAG: VOC family protein [Microthrixaceae bacterium]
MPPQFRVTRMFHPSHHVTDLDAAEAWFAEVFARPSTPLSSLTQGAPSSSGYPSDYSTFTLIGDVLFDSIDPQRYVLEGIQRYASVDRPHLKGIGWYVEGMSALYEALRAAGIAVIDQFDEVAEGERPPTAAGSKMPLFFTSPRDTGLRYELFPAIDFPLDPRPTDPGWIPPPLDGDPLGIERCSHHTVLTDRPDRALRFAVDVMGGSVVHEGRDEVAGAHSTYVALADSIIEYAVPDPRTHAEADLADQAPGDTYHSITFEVRDLDAVHEHLTSRGVEVRTRTDDTIVTEPESSLGVPWGFTTATVPTGCRRPT